MKNDQRRSYIYKVVKHISLYFLKGLWRITIRRRTYERFVVIPGASGSETGWNRSLCESVRIEHIATIPRFHRANDLGITRFSIVSRRIMIAISLSDK